MATAAPLHRSQPVADDFTGRLPPAVPGADQLMVAQPYADPGYAMPNVDIGNLNQMPGQAVGGYLPAGWATPPNALSQQLMNYLRTYGYGV